MRTRWWTPLLLAILVPLAGCGATYAAGGGGAPAAQGSGAAADPGAVSSTPPASSSTSASAGRPISAPAQVTTADNNRTIKLKVGQSFTLALGDLQWKPTVADPAILALVPDVPLPSGAQGIYRAAKAGTTTLRATGAPHCGAGQACPMFVMLFQVTVQVTA